MSDGDRDEQGDDWTLETERIVLKFLKKGVKKFESEKVGVHVSDINVICFSLD